LETAAAANDQIRDQGLELAKIESLRGAEKTSHEAAILPLTKKEMEQEQTFPSLRFDLALRSHKIESLAAEVRSEMARISALTQNLTEHGAKIGLLSLQVTALLGDANSQFKYGMALAKGESVVLDKG
jgi:hypothetical protein